MHARVGPAPSWTRPAAILRYVWAPNGLRADDVAAGVAAPRKALNPSSTSGGGEAILQPPPASDARWAALSRLQDGEYVEVENFGGPMWNTCPPFCGLWANLWRGTGVFLRVKNPLVSYSKTTAIVDMLSVIGERTGGAMHLAALASAMRINKLFHAARSRHPAASAAACLVAALVQSAMASAGAPCTASDGWQSTLRPLVRGSWLARASALSPEEIVRRLKLSGASSSSSSKPSGNTAVDATSDGRDTHARAHGHNGTAVHGRDASATSSTEDAAAFALHWIWGACGIGTWAEAFDDDEAAAAWAGFDAMLARLACMLGVHTLILGFSPNDNGLLHSELVDFDLPAPLAWPVPPAGGLNPVDGCLAPMRKPSAQVVGDHYMRTGKFALRDPTEPSARGSRCDLYGGGRPWAEAAHEMLSRCAVDEDDDEEETTRPSRKQCWTWCKGQMSQAVAQMDMATKLQPAAVSQAAKDVGLSDTIPSLQRPQAAQATADEGEGGDDGEQAAQGDGPEANEAVRQQRAQRAQGHGPEEANAPVEEQRDDDDIRIMMSDVKVWAGQSIPQRVGSERGPQRSQILERINETTTAVLSAIGTTQFRATYPTEDLPPLQRGKCSTCRFRAQTPPPQCRALLPGIAPPPAGSAAEPARALRTVDGDCTERYASMLSCGGMTYLLSRIEQFADDACLTCAEDFPGWNEVAAISTIMRTRRDDAAPGTPFSKAAIAIEGWARFAPLAHTAGFLCQGNDTHAERLVAYGGEGQSTQGIVRAMAAAPAALGAAQLAWGATWQRVVSAVKGEVGCVDETKPGICEFDGKNSVVSLPSGGGVLLFTRSNMRSRGGRHVQVSHSADGVSLFSRFEQLRFAGYTIAAENNIYNLAVRVLRFGGCALLLGLFPAAIDGLGGVWMSLSADGVEWARPVRLLGSRVLPEWRTADHPVDWEPSGAEADPPLRGAGAAAATFDVPVLIQHAVAMPDYFETPALEPRAQYVRACYRGTLDGGEGVTHFCSHSVRLTVELANASHLKVQVGTPDATRPPWLVPITVGLFEARASECRASITRASDKGGTRSAARDPR